MTTYTVDQLATGLATITVDDTDGGLDWLAFDGSFIQVTDINLNWTYTGSAGTGAPTSASGIYYTPNGASFDGHRLVVNGAIENARGSVGQDSIQGNSLANALYGDFSRTSAGLSDTISGGYGNDSLYGGAGNDVLNGGNDNDLLFGDAGADTISGNEGRDTIVGGLGADVLSGGADGNDLLSYTTSLAGVRVQLTYGATTVAHGGEAEGDTINGFNNVNGSGFGDVITDTVTGTISFGYNANNFSGNAGNDRLNLGGGDDYGSGGNDNDTLYGGAGNDTLLGGAGADFLYGGLGRDVLAGGFGADRFVFSTAPESPAGTTTRDVINDFVRSDGDKIDLRAIDADATLALNQAFVWRGTGAFTGHAGDLREVAFGTGWAILGDRDGDRVTDFAITVHSIAGALIATDVLL